MASLPRAMGPTTVPGPASLPIMKLSHCTSQNLQAKVTWTHLANRDDMYVVFDLLRTNVSDGSVKEHSVLKVVTAGELFVKFRMFNEGETELTAWNRTLST